MKYLFYTLALCLALSGCDSKESQSQHDAKVAKEAREQLLSELKAKEEAKKEKEQNSSLYKFGITKEGSRITIDTNKTKTYFDEVAKTLSAQVNQFANEVKHGDAGIEADKSQITIDVNKTGRFLDNWAQKMQNFAEELDMLSASFEENRTHP